jgi:hypothetical protein
VRGRTLILGLLDDARLFEQVILDEGASHSPLLPPVTVKVHLHPPAEARRVVVADGLCVTERLEDRVGAQDALLNAALGARHISEELEALLGRLCLRTWRTSWRADGRAQTAARGDAAAAAMKGIAEWRCDGGDGDGGGGGGGGGGGALRRGWWRRPCVLAEPSVWDDACLRDGTRTLPAPLSPEMRMEASRASRRMKWYAAEAMAYGCGSRTVLGAGVALAASASAP